MAKEELLSEAEREQNAYYLQISRKLTRARYLLLLFAVIAVVLTVWGYRNRITYDNLRYLLRDVDEAASASVIADAIYYNAEDTNVYLLFRGDLAVCSSAGVSLRRSLGGRSFDDKVALQSPVAKCSEKYMIVYDVGGSAIYVYNSVSRVFDATFTTPIVDAAVAKSGAFAVVTREKTGDYKISLYDKNFDLRAALTRQTPVYTVGFLGERLYLCECRVTDSTFGTDLSFYTAGKEELDQTLSFSGAVLSVGELGKGFYILTDRALRVCDANGATVRETSFGTADVLFADGNKNGVSVCTAENTAGGSLAIYAFPKDGEPTVKTAEKGAKGFARVGESAVLLYDGKLIVQNADGQKEIEIPLGGRKLFTVSDSAVTVCYDDYAKTFAVK